MPLLQVEETARTAEDLMAKITRLGMEIAYFGPAVRTMLAGDSSAWVASSISRPT